MSRDYTVENAEGAALFAMDRVANAIQMMTEFSDELRRRLRECEENRNSANELISRQRAANETLLAALGDQTSRTEGLIGENAELRDEILTLRAAAEEV